jgi:glycerol-3-phosphate dehydrogenase (NAD(P)+)
MANITIIGAGMMGTGICTPLADNGHAVRLVGTPLDEEIIQNLRSQRYHPKHKRRIPDGVQPFDHTQLIEALCGADVVITAVSSFGVEWFMQQVTPHLSSNAPLVSLTKGLALLPEGGLRTLPDEIEARLAPHLQGKLPLCAVSGPCIAQELAARRQTFVVLCGRDEAVLQRLQAWFATPYYHVKTSTDQVGEEVCAALKNTYAIAVNLAIGEYERCGADGIAHMFNPQAALFSRSLEELGILVSLLGGDPRSAAGLSGAGDLFVTVFGGRNARLGRLLGSGKTYAQAREALAGETLEGVETLHRVTQGLAQLEEQGKARRADYPLLMHLHQVIAGGEPAPIDWMKLESWS